MPYVFIMNVSDKTIYTLFKSRLKMNNEAAVIVEWFMLKNKLL